MPSVKLELLTPCFCAGVDQGRPEIRVPSIRGQLRFWTRLLFDPHHDGKAEYLLFGGIKGRQHGYDRDAVASPVSLRLCVPAFTPQTDVLLCPHDGQKGRRNAVPAGTQFGLVWHERLAHSDERLAKFVNVLDAWSLLGALGARETRAAGSVWPVGYAPTVQDYQARVTRLGVPNDVRVAVLGRTENQADNLRRIATDTVNGLGSGTFRRDPLGFVGRGRKVSPLKLKVGRFADGLRLIAVADDRDGRGGDLAAAVRAMCQAGKEIGELLQEVGWDQDTASPVSTRTARPGGRW